MSIFENLKLPIILGIVLFGVSSIFGFKVEVCVCEGVLVVEDVEVEVEEVVKAWQQGGYELRSGQS